MSSTTATLGEFRDEKDMQIAQLKAEKEVLSVAYTYITEQYASERALLRKEIMDLQEEKEHLYDAEGARTCLNLVDKEDLDEAKAEIEELKAKLIFAHKNADAEEHAENAGILIEENDRLTEENEKLKKEVYGLELAEGVVEADLALKAFKKSLERNNALKEEVAELNKQLMRSWEIRTILIADNDCLLEKVKEMGGDGLPHPPTTQCE